MPKQKKLTVADLAKIIQANPHCVATVDNDGWVLRTKAAAESEYQEHHEQLLACESDMEPWTGGYGGGHIYGGDILQALAHLQGIKVESV